MASEHIARRQVYARQFDTASEDFEINLEDISAPALVIHGLRDRLVHPSTAQALARRIPDTRILLMSAVGHAPQWEQPRQTQTAIATFLAEVEAAREVTAVA